MRLPAAQLTMANQTHEYLLSVYGSALGYVEEVDAVDQQDGSDFEEEQNKAA